MSVGPNAFGDVRAENDHRALDATFYEWQDYKTLFEATDRFIVVGRRGTGKSALTYQLNKIWRSRHSPIILVAPNEEEVIGLRPLATMFGSTVSRIRAGIKLAWRYALLMEIGLNLQEDYKTRSQVKSSQLLTAHINAWRSKGGSCVGRLRSVLRESLRGVEGEENRIADLAGILQLNRLTEDVASVVGDANKQFVILVDRLDEGYEPDSVGTGIVDGILYGTDEIRTLLGSKVRAVVFIRDNIFRAIEDEDKDFSRNLESQVLRLHWDQQELFYMVAKRVRFLFGVNKESDEKVWNSITSAELHGREGFKKCLQLTLYRPRDLIALLNAAYYQAQRQQRQILIEDDFDKSAKLISMTRYGDLGKEYESVFPGVSLLTSTFANGASTVSWSHAVDNVRRAMKSQDLSKEAAQHFAILEAPETALHGLYGIGFIGVYDRTHGSYVFSHDGKRADKNFGPDDRMMVHPCYWSALNLGHDKMDQAEAEQIYDEYEITIASHSSEERKKLLGQIISELNTIPLGSEGATRFEDWSKRALGIAFARQLVNIQLKPNSSATQRRDIVATNEGQGVWRRIVEDYGTRQVIFEVKNYDSIRVNEFRQVHSYLGKEYGRLGFIVCRDPVAGLQKGGELDAFREFYAKDSLIVKLTANQVVGILSKLRSPDKSDAGELLLARLLDTYVRMYAAGQSDVGIGEKL
jgi:energy-coupling factor transporter ATP-binding protein EcfA2